MTAGELAARIGSARSVAQRTWLTVCPACRGPYEDDERGGSALTIREARDGRVLLYCALRCHPRAIVAAAGITMADLFPAKPAVDRAA